ncbi:MAG: hypothetical protein UU15_C0026G0004 [Candidatus Levybacteria bacterium GW2011_GWC2_40_7]|nr:MAG: hypothetical protein UU15_C0026G0004 [Candidatus Levybacteria bacterium GW2011_GWC2_40_7]
MLKKGLVLAAILLPLVAIITLKTPVKSLILPEQKPIVSPIAKTTPAILPASTSITATLTPTKKPPAKLTKSTYSIALIGDSMVDTMGENLEYLDRSLKGKYETTSFKLYNYGIGAQNVEMGLERLNSPFTNRERNYPPITQINADIIIIGSFSYNPFDPHNPQKHKDLLGQMIEETKKYASQVYVLVEIAPLGKTFGKGTNGVNLPEDKAEEHALRIIEQLNDTIEIAAGRSTGIWK